MQEGDQVNINTAFISCIIVLIMGCYSTKVPEGSFSFRLNTQADDEYRLGYLEEPPIIVKGIGNKKPKSPNYDCCDDFLKFNFHVIEDYRPSEIKESWDNTVYSMLIREGADSTEIVRVPSVYRDTTVTLYYPIKKNSDIKKLNRCYVNGTLILAYYFTETKEIEGVFTPELYNFHPSYLDSLTPASIYKKLE